jgi:hypothetical protein
LILGNIFTLTFKHGTLLLMMHSHQYRQKMFHNIFTYSKCYITYFRCKNEKLQCFEKDPNLCSKSKMHELIMHKHQCRQKYIKHWHLGHMLQIIFPCKNENLECLSLGQFFTQTHKGNYCTLELIMPYIN